MNNRSDNQNRQNQNALFAPLAGGKGAGLAYSAMIVLFIAASFVFSLLLSANGWTDSEALAEKDWYQYLCYLLSPVCILLVALWYFFKSKTPFKSVVRSQKCHWKYYIVALVLQIGLLSLSQANSWFVGVLEKIGYESEMRIPGTDGFGLVGVLFAVALLPAVTEEIFFRGILLKGLKSFSAVGSVLLCGGLFALYHMSPAQTIYQFCCGAAFALVAVKAGSVLPTMFSHFLNNALVVILYKFGVETFSTPVLISVLAVSVLCLIGSLVYLIFFDKKPEEEMGKEEKKTERKRFFLFASVGLAMCGIMWISALLG